MSLYHNPELGERVASMGVIDRFLRIGVGTCENVLTLTISTDPNGIVMVMLTLDWVIKDVGLVYCTLLAVYPLNEQMHAQEDALLLSRKWELSLRRATPEVGWQWVRDTDAVQPGPGSDLVIGA